MHLLILLTRLAWRIVETRCWPASTSTSPRIGRCCTPHCGRPRDRRLVVDGVDVVPEVHEVLAKVYAFADKVRSGEWVGVTGKPIATVVNIGIGGSDLGPVMVYEALQPYVKPGLKARFISNIDPTDVAEKTKDLDPETTLFIVASKTFTTLETLTNARLARSLAAGWIAGFRGHRGRRRGRNAAVAKHFVAVSTALDKVAAFGIDPDNAFGFWDWVGGRYSVDSAIGTSVAVAIGPENFADFLAGFHAIDGHFAETEFSNNVPVLMGLLNVWYVNFFKAASHAVLAVRAVPAPIPGVPAAAHHGVQRQGRPLGRLAGDHRHRRGVLGRAGHQRPARLLPADPPGHPADPGRLHRGGQPGATRWSTATTTYTGCSWPTSSPRRRHWPSARRPNEVRAEGTPEAIVSARVFPGNRPTTSIMASDADPAVVGELIALYEHITFTEGVVWGIDSFDQWGVELGKQLALQIAPAVSGDDEALAQTRLLNPVADQLLPLAAHLALGGTDQAGGL